MKASITTLLVLILLALAAPSTASETVQGPIWKNKNLTVLGEVIAHGVAYQSKPCVMLRVIPNEDHKGGRAWVCDEKISFSTYPIGSTWNCAGKVTDLRMTHVGPRRRPMPLMVNPSCQLSS